MTITINGTTGIAGVDGSAGTPAVQGADTNTGVFFGTDTVTISTGGTAAVTVDSGQRTKFPTTIGVGGATPAASGAGITFPATASASSDANTLDDYEEGTWTPVLTFGGSSTGITYDISDRGLYTKVGNIVTVFVRMVLTSKGSASGSALVTGLPFTSKGGQFVTGCSLAGFNNLTFANQLIMQIGENTTEVQIFEVTEAGGRTDITNSDFANNTRLSWSATYLV
jgi:hypothetical protein